MSKKHNILDIVNADLCTGCGICISESSGKLKMDWNDHGFLTPKPIGHLNDSDSDAVKVCPFNPQPEENVKDEDNLATIFLNKSKHLDEKIGRYENIYVGYSDKFRSSSSSGGLATYIFEQLLEQNIVQNLFIVKEVNGTYEYQWFSDFKQIKLISKTRYLPVTMENLFKEIDSKEGKVAVSGVACFIKAIRLKQYYHPHYKVKIPFLVGIICGGLKSKFFTDYLAQKAGITSSYRKQDYRIKDPNSTAPDYSFGAFNDEKELKKVRMVEVGDMWGSGLFKSNACDFCDDVTTELADISLGDAWLNPYAQEGLGNSVIVTRSTSADNLIKNGISKGDLSIGELSLNLFKQSQLSSFYHRQDALKYRVDNIRKHKKIIPSVRSKFFTSIPIYFKIVQKHRMIVRKKSLSTWKLTRNKTAFDNLMKPFKTKLQKHTLLYHKIRKIKNILNKLK
ncbi:Coenzyme F420 hydrogenase/dehydrogenase, beta subunit C-terminal domain [Flavobacterium gelidilacus]|uniref:Coenzyme F420 hydrogenase/dehydrogenase, beta subunit C-terminal domain n=1 Tax=Flavobacterium gelidilacus TaxID=206041 RepID=UPI000416A630|nr:Coenzyme F420 hydrogenase/dehydrogenase, beta subunit C-terminal domain [Flavobacterium gelidilacus]